MDVSSFYVNGPYLHHDPKAVPSGVEDYFTHVVEPQVKREINSNYERAKQELQRKAKASQQFEREFYRQFNVQSPEEFSKKYLVDLTKSGLAKKEVDKLLKDGSISQRIIYIINKQDILNTVLSRSIQDLESVLRELFTEESADQVLNNIEGVELAESSGAFIESLMARAFSNIGGSATSTVGDGIQVSLSTSGFKGSCNKQITAQIENLLKRKNNKNYNRAKGYRRAVEIIRKRINIRLKTTQNKVIANIKKDLMNEQYMPLSLFNGDEELRSSIVNGVLQRVQEYLFNQITAKGGLFFKSPQEAAGGLFNLGIETGFQSELSVQGIEKVVMSIGDKHSKRIDSSRNPELPSDLNVDKRFMLQLKSQRGGMLTPMRGEQRAINTFNDLLQSQIISADDIRRFKYLLVNYIQRGETDKLNSTLVNLVNWGVEIFIRSDTVSSLLESVQGLPTGGAALGSPYDATVAQNHFWIVNNNLIPISTFLFSIVDVMEDHEKIEKWYSISGNIGGSPYPNDKLYEEKLSANDPNTVKWFDPAVLGIGIVAGEKVYQSARIPTVSLSNDFVNSVNELIGRYGV